MNQSTNQQPWLSLSVISCFFTVFKCVIKFMGGRGWNAPHPSALPYTSMALIRLNQMTSKLNGSLISKGKSMVPPEFSACQNVTVFRGSTHIGSVLEAMRPLPSHRV